ncbi:MAG: ComEC/Rec2 family competence protein [Candidatus Hydrothermales bacterium]
MLLLAPFKYLSFLPLGNIHYNLNKPNEKKIDYPILFKKLNSYFKNKIKKMFEDKTEDFMLAMILGERTKIEKKVLRDFIRTGTLHFLAISGLHMVIITSIFIFLFLFFRINFKKAILFSIFAITFYVTIVPLRPSVLRSFIMIIFYLSSLLQSKRVHPLSIIGNAGLLSLFLFPESAFDPGFHLSYLATIGISVLFPLFEKPKIKNSFIRNFLYLPFCVSLSAQVFVYPYIYFFFKNISIVAPLSNIILSPLTFLSLLGGILTIISADICPFISLKFANFSEFITHITFITLDYLSRISPFFYTEKVNYAVLSVLIFLPILLYSLKILYLRK